MHNKSTSQQTTFLAIGDVHGHWDYVIEAISSATDILGHVPDLVLQVGDAEALRNEADLATVHVPNKYRAMGLFSALQPGDLACPVYFIGGNHEPYEMLDIAAMNSNTLPIPWGPDVYYLGRAGAMSIGGINIAWLSGIERVEMLPARNIGKKERTYYLESEAELAKRRGSMLGDIDVVISHDWPSGIRDGKGTALIRSISEKLQPQLHVCGHMHSHHEAAIGKMPSMPSMRCRVLAMVKIHTGGGGCTEKKMAISDVFRSDPKGSEKDGMGVQGNQGQLSRPA